MERIELESVKKLREYADMWQEKNRLLCNNLNILTDEIETEVGELLGKKVVGAISEDEHGTEWVTMPADELTKRYMELPLDADGVPVHIGDIMTYADKGNPKEVIALTATAVYLCDDGPRYTDMCRHYQPDTWERIIEDAILRGYDEPHAEKGGYITKESLVERCKALAKEEQR